MTIIGLGEDGLAGLSNASKEALAGAEIVTGAARHLSLLPDLTAQTQLWPVPFVDGIEQLLALRGRTVVVLASGDPFWFGAGSILAQHLDTDEWQAFPSPSVVSLAAAYLGWPLEKTAVFGLHAAPLSRLRPALQPGVNLLVLLRDGPAATNLATYLVQQGFGASCLWIMESLGGPRERVRITTAQSLDFDDISHPVCAAMALAGDGLALPLSSGLADSFFDHDGQITKRPMRAVTLSSLAPLAGQHLWDIGAGSGAIGIEWMLAHPSNQTTAIEPNPTRAARIRRNAVALGTDLLNLVESTGLDFLNRLPQPTPPNAVFIGGGLSEQLLQRLWTILPKGTRLVANSVTLETDGLLAQWQRDVGGDLMRFDIANSTPLGAKRGWKAAFPVTQWSVLK